MYRVQWYLVVFTILGFLSQIHKTMNSYEEQNTRTGKSDEHNADENSTKHSLPNLSSPHKNDNNNNNYKKYCRSEISPCLNSCK